MATILAVGGASLDPPHVAGEAAGSAGGAGVFTATAAHRSDAGAALFARRPSPLPEKVHPVAGKLSAWLGPSEGAKRVAPPKCEPSRCPGLGV
jgi:hypothetical protein